MRVIGGYLELDNYTLPMMHEEAIPLNCGRNALMYLIRAKNIRKILLPKYICDSVIDTCIKGKAEIRYYKIGIDFLPCDIEMEKGEWLYIVNYCGQISNDIIQKYKDYYINIIVDNAQAYFQPPVNNLDTIYTCRKFFGVSDGAFLYTDSYIEQMFETDLSYERMHYLLGRYEKDAEDFYLEYVNNNNCFKKEPIKFMSKLTKNLLHAIDYSMVCEIRKDNFTYLHSHFKGINCIKNLIIPEGPFMYPLYLKNGNKIRKKLQEIKIYTPLLWPNILKQCNENSLEYEMANNVLYLPVDQRYNEIDMKIIINEISKMI